MEGQERGKVSAELRNEWDTEERKMWSVLKR
jgi:hypothetical protein